VTIIDFPVRAEAVTDVAFVFTRLLAEGVRLFASATPIKLLLDELGVVTSYGTIRREEARILRPPGRL
jgi:SSS family solute:Na+ symporter